MRLAAIRVHVETLLTTSRLYRAKTLFELKADLRKELEWLNPTALRHLKNYQIWHHRHMMIEAIAAGLQPGSEELDELMRDETDFIAKMFATDAKNYHVWSYRQWLVQQFGLWESPRELEAVNELLKKDVRNNSAWNHRYYVVFGRPNASKDATKDRETMQREITFAASAIQLAPQNEAPWNYLRGVLSHYQMPLSNIKIIANQYAKVESPGDVKSSHALDILADIYKEEKEVEKAGKALDLLAEQYDPIRSRYWMWRKEQLGTVSA